MKEEDSNDGQNSDTFGISKGGCSKSTSSGMTSYLLSQKEKVLAIDMDGQGNLTNFLTSEYDICNVFEERTILEAIKNENARPYIIKIIENLDLKFQQMIFSQHYPVECMKKA